jgi:hypothetical protein
MPIFLAVRMIRQAISPRLAMSIFLNNFLPNVQFFRKRSGRLARHMLRT